MKHMLSIGHICTCSFLEQQVQAHVLNNRVLLYVHMYDTCVVLCVCGGKRNSQFTPFISVRYMCSSVCVWREEEFPVHPLH